MLTASHIIRGVDKGLLLYLTGLVYGESVDLLVNTGVSNSFASCRLVQALQLAIDKYKRTQVSLPDGSQLTSSLVCKFLVWLNAIYISTCAS